MLLQFACALCAGFVTAFLALAYQLPLWFLLVFLLPSLVPAYRLFCIAMLLSALAFVIFAGAQLQRGLPLSADKHSALISVHLVELPQRKQGLAATKYTVALNQPLNFQAFTLPTGSRIRLSDYADLDMEVGENWQLQAVLRSPRGLVNAAGFDYRRWLLSERIAATAYVVADSNNIKLGERPASLLALRYTLAKNLDKTLIDRPSRALIKALVLGDTSSFTQEHRAVLQQTGVAHLFVISGLHIGLFAVLAWWFGRGLGVICWWPLRTGYAVSVQALSGLVGAIAYAALAGFSLPTVRALIMVAVVLIAALPRRHYRPIHAVIIAAALILMWDPLALLGMSFWLSFTAVTVLLYAWQSEHRIRALVLSQISIFLAMTVVLCLFGMPVSLIAPIVNLIAIPLLSLLLVPLCLLATALLMLGFGQLFTVVQFIFDGLWRVLTVLAEFDGATVFLAPSLLSVAIALAGLVFSFRYRRYWWVAFLAQLPLWFLPAKQEQNLRVTVLDVGQGLAVFAQHQNYNVLYDTGAAFSSGFSMAEAVIEPNLYRLGVRRLDALIISHGDNDHAGGVSYVATVFKPDRTIVPQQLLASYPQSDACQDQGVINFGDLRLRFLSAGLEDASSNDGSCVVEISYQGFVMLLTGDISKLAEFSVLAKQQLAADVLLVPHHGSRSSSSDSLIDAVRPQLAVVSAGFNNRFGHPHEEVLLRYKARHVPVLNTAELGAIDIYIDQNGVITKLERARDYRFGFWH